MVDGAGRRWSQRTMRCVVRRALPADRALKHRRHRAEEFPRAPTVRHDRRIRRDR